MSISKKLQIFGILNCTPNSYYDGGLYQELGKAIEHGHQLIRDGAHYIDIGGESTRPGAKSVPIEEELKRVIPVVRALNTYPLSIDTQKPEVARRALEAGASIINDITGFQDPMMRRLAAESQSPIIVMHMQGTPQTMQVSPHYPNGVVQEIKEWFQKRINLLIKEGVSPSQIILDPGIGFGKTIFDNVEIIENISTFTTLGFPVMIAASRKSFIQKILNKNATETLSTTLAVHTMSILEGASYLRVHDVKEHKDLVSFFSALRERPRATKDTNCHVACASPHL